MPRQARVAPGGIVYHVINRGVGRMTLFEDGDDYAAFERCLRLPQEHVSLELFCSCVMPNHWHLMVRPAADDDLGTFMQRLSPTSAAGRITPSPTMGEPVGHIGQTMGRDHTRY